MASVSYSVPEDVKRAFDEALAHRNKSAIIAELMRAAVEEQKQVGRRALAVERLLNRRSARPSMTSQDIRATPKPWRE